MSSVVSLCDSLINCSFVVQQFDVPDLDWLESVDLLDTLHNMSL